MERKVIQVEERPPLLLNIPLSIQHLFAMFGAEHVTLLLYLKEGRRAQAKW